MPGIFLTTNVFAHVGGLFFYPDYGKLSGLAGRWLGRDIMRDTRGLSFFSV